MTSREVRAPVVVGVNGTRAALGATRWAAQEARRGDRPLLLLAVDDAPAMTEAAWPGWNEWCAEDGYLTETLRQAAEVATAAGASSVTARGVVGSPAAELLSAAAGAAMLVLGRSAPRADGLYRYVLAQAATHAEGTVVVVPEDVDARPTGEGGVLLGVDTGEYGAAAVEFAFDQAACLGHPLVALRCWTALGEEPALREPYPHPADLEEAQRRLLSEALAGWSGKYPDVRVSHQVVRRSAAGTLIEAGRDFALTVVGARGAGGFPGLRLGSVADALVRHSHCPVAVVR